MPAPGEWGSACSAACGWCGACTSGPAPEEREFKSFPKPIRGQALLARRETRAQRVAAEQKAMRAALVRDRMQCRWPKCEFKKRDLPIDPCHQTHRGAGGNPDGSRTTRKTVIALCRIHHGRWDAGEIDVQPLTDQGFDGPVTFYAKHADTGRLEQIASEQTIGVSTERGR